MSAAALSGAAVRRDLYRADGVRITHDPFEPGMAEKYGAPGKTDSEGFDPYADSVGPGIYGGIVKRDANGQVIFGSVDRSGFVTQEYISPTTGRRSVRSVYVDRVGYTLKLDLIFVRGSDGSVVYDTTLLQDEIVNLDEGDALGVFYNLAQRFRHTFLGIMLPTSRTETRYLFTE